MKIIGVSGIISIVGNYGSNPGTAPTFSAAPVVSGATTPGATLARTLGTATSSITGAWFKNGSTTGVTTSTYSSTVDGDDMFWRSSATNAYGTTTSDSNTVSVIASAPSEGQSIDITGIDQSLLEDGFRLESSTTSDSGPWDEVDTFASLTGTGDPIEQTVGGFSDNTKYWLRLVAENGDGENATEAFEITTRPIEAPSGLTATMVDDTSILYEWTEPDDLPLGGYFIEHRTSGAWEPLINLAVGATSYTATSLQPETTYTARVHSTNSGSSFPSVLTSNEANATTDAAPPVIGDTFDGTGALSANWTILAGTDMVRDAGEVICPGTTDVNYVVWNDDVLNPDQWVQFTIRNDEGDSQIYFGLWGRLADDEVTGYYYNFNTNNSAYLNRVNNGTETLIAGPEAHAWDAGDICRVEFEDVGADVQIRIYKNTVLVDTFLDTGSVIASGNAGIGMLSFATTIRCDDFLCGNL
jgi:hypothetical protein